MSTDLIVGLPSILQMEKSISLTYNPWCGILSNKRVYSETIGEVVSETIAGDESEIISSLSNAIIGSGDTEIGAIKATKSKKTFNKIFRGHKYTESNYQHQTALPELNNRVIRAYTKYWDKATWKGADGNNGVFSSTDANYILESSSNLASAPSGSAGIDALIALVSSAIAKSDLNIGSTNLVIGIYGSTLTSWVDKLVPNTQDTYLSVLMRAFPQVGFSKVPASVLTSTENGLVVLANDLITLHMTTMPKIVKAGVNDENSYAWVKYVLGNAMVDLKEYGAIIRQPVAFV